jgi:hypothetical protein
MNIQAGMIPQQQPINAWTNAARNGTSPATVAFVQMADGRIYSQSLVSGRVRTWRPKKHIVISSDPRMSMISKLDRTHRRVVKRIKKLKGIK